MSATTPPTPPAAIAWPKEPPTADDLFRYAVGRGVWLSGCASAYVDAGMFERDDETLRQWHLNAVTQMIHLHDIALLLRELWEQDPQRADEMAEKVWTAAEAGDSYGEWLWQWASESGLAPGAIYEAGQVSANHRIAADAERLADPRANGSERA